MRGGRILWGQITVVFTIVLVMTWAATQWVAFRLGFQPQLGNPWFDLVGWPVYYPPAFFWWWFSFDAYAPAIFVEGAIIAASGGSAVARPDRLAAVVADGEEMTYDLSVEGPWHNFLADGIVVHNSYNEESGRYRELRPVFYVPAEDRKLVQQGRPGKYEFVPGTQEQHKVVTEAMEESYRQAYQAYQEMLAAGVAREVARATLPVGLYSSMYATCNARSLMHFLGLRTQHEMAAVPSFPQREIEMVGELMERHWAGLMPLTHAAFNTNGRVAP
jgi:flavin-dependent thymidylate synthase